VRASHVSVPVTPTTSRSSVQTTIINKTN
jgi:hypothetical protein